MTSEGLATLERRSTRPAPLLLTNMFPVLTETFISDFVALLLQHDLVPRVLPLFDRSDDLLLEGPDAPSVVASRIPPVAQPSPVGKHDQLPWWASELLEADSRTSLDVSAICERLEGELAAPGSVLHAHFLTPPGVIGALCLERSRHPSVLELHGYDIFRVGRTHWRAAAEVFRRYDVVITSCGEMRLTVARILEQAGIRQWPEVLILNHGIDIEVIDALQACANGNNDSLRVVTVARLVEKKGLSYLLLAFSDVLKILPGATLDIVGSGPQEADLKVAVERLGLSGSVTFHGALPRSLALRLLAGARLCVLPCVEAQNGDMDAVPNSLMEAQALGVPVVSTYLAGIPEIVRHGITGILVQPGERASLAQAIVLALNSPFLSAQMGKAGRAWARQELNMRDRLARYFSIYESG